MQSVVTGQAPITLERKITSGGKQMKTEDNIHKNWSKSYISRQKIKRRDQRTYYTYQGTYHVLNESHQKPKPWRQHSTHKKKIRWNKRCPKSKSHSWRFSTFYKIEQKGKEEKKNKTNQQERKKTARKGNTRTSGSQAFPVVHVWRPFHVPFPEPVLDTAVYLVPGIIYTRYMYLGI